MSEPYISKQQIEKVINFAETRCEINDFNHNMDHIKLTAKLSRYLAAKEGANIHVCLVAAYLHDIGKNSSNNHGATGARMARNFLKSIGVPNSFIARVCYCISQHNNGSPKRIKEARVLWDADKLQLIGPLGFSRILRHALLFFKEKDIYKAIKRAKRYEKFYYERFYTKTGRQIARNQHNFMEEFHTLCESIIKVKF